MTERSVPTLVDAWTDSEVRGHAEELPVLEIEGGPGRVNLDTLRELWRFREVLWAFSVRTVKVAYKQAAIGLGWAVLQPLLMALVFSIFLGKLSGVGGEGAPKFLFALAGTSAWAYFSGAANSAMNSVVANAALLRKVYFPREVLPLSAVVAAMVDLVPQLAILLVTATIYGYHPSVTWLALPLPLLVIVLCSAALGIAVSGPNVYYRDVRYAVPFLLSLGLFASPIAYSLSVVPGDWRTIYAILNPIAATVDSIRRIVIHHTWPEPEILAGAFGWTLLLFLLGYALFKRLERSFADRV